MRRLVKLLGGKGEAIQRVHMPLVLGRQRENGPSRGLSEREVVYLVRDVRERQVQVLIGRVHRLKVHGAWDALRLQVAGDAAALAENGVVGRSRVHVPLGDLSAHPLRQGLGLARAVVVLELALLGAPAVEPNAREAVDLLQLASCLEVHAIDLQRSDVRDGAVCVLGLEGLGACVHAILETLPNRRELPTMSTPIGVEIDQGEVVRTDHSRKVFVLEVVAGRPPIGVQLSHLLPGEALARKLELDKLILCVRMSFSGSLVIDALLLHVLRDVHLLRAECVPNTDSDMITIDLQHVHIEIDAEDGIGVAIDNYSRRRLRCEEGRSLTHEQRGAYHNGHDGHHRTQHRGLCQVFRQCPKGIIAVIPTPPSALRQHAAVTQSPKRTAHQQKSFWERAGSSTGNKCELQNAVPAPGNLQRRRCNRAKATKMA
mmetsp:Transcript_92400/g.234876  ORF Transcript_92400/g.234876 Transcript_92400/m.234876 type:complete len:429 (+) Transcript_92400:398-1684(+)